MLPDARPASYLEWLMEILRWPQHFQFGCFKVWMVECTHTSSLQHRWIPNITVGDSVPSEKWSKSAVVKTGHGSCGKLLWCQSDVDLFAIWISTVITSSCPDGHLCETSLKPVCKLLSCKWSSHQKRRPSHLASDHQSIKWTDFLQMFSRNTKTQCLRPRLTPK